MLGVLTVTYMLSIATFYQLQKVETINPLNKENLKSAGFWVLAPIHIDGNGWGDYKWLDAKQEDWCSGSGSIADPYRLTR